MKKKYEPKLSEELKKHLEKEGTLNQFLNDYRQMCNNFKPAKIFVPGKEPKPKTYEELSEEERRELEKLGRSYAHALHQLLEFGLKANKKGVEYTLIGGLGVLGHLYDYNYKFPLKWRGTEDIDILTKDNLSELYLDLGFKKIQQERIDLSMIPDGKMDTYIKENPYHDRPVKIQDRKTIKFPGARGITDESKKLHQDKEMVKFYGVPIMVASKEHLIATKTGYRRRKDKLKHLKDDHDIEHLKSIKKKLESIVEEDSGSEGENDEGDGEDSNDGGDN